MSDFSGFEIIDDRGDRQVSDTFYDASMTGVLTINGRTRLNHDFYALLPTSSTDTINPALENNGTKPLVGGVGKVCFFDFAMSATSAGFGIEVFDGNGKVTFSSSAIPLDVIDVIEFDDITSQRGSDGVYFRRRYDSNVVPAVLPLRTPFWAVRSSPSSSSNDLVTVGYCVNGSELIAKTGMAFEGGWPPIAFNFYKGYKAIVIDVKRYSNIV